MIDTKEMRRDADDAYVAHVPLEICGSEILELLDRLEAAEEAWKISDQTVYDLTEKVIPNIQEKLEAAEKEARNLREGLKRMCLDEDAAAKEAKTLRAKIAEMEKRLHLILEEPENTMSNSKAMREMLRQARLALEKSK